MSVAWILVLLTVGWASTDADVDVEQAQVLLPSSGAEIVIESRPNAAVQSALGHLREGRFELAAVALRALADAGGGPSLRYHEALAWYEAGQLRRARAAVEVALRHDRASGPALSLLGLILVDVGDGDRAREVFDSARERAEALGDRALLARIALNEGLLSLDLGDPVAAAGRFEQALGHAVAAGDGPLGALARSNRDAAQARLGEGGGGDLLDRVAARLRVGDIAGARASVPRSTDQDRRAGARALLADAAIDRAEGLLDSAHVKARTALNLARDGGLVRETAAALSQIGGLYMLAGRFEHALETYQEAIGVVGDTTLRAQELSIRVEAGRAAVRTGDLRQAGAQLDGALAVARRVQDPLAAIRLDELRALLLDAKGDPDGAAGRLEAAYKAYQSREAHADTARVATDLVAHHAGRSDPGRQRWIKAALQAFQAIGDAAGPAHVAVAEGLGFARRRQLEPALAAFARAASAAEALGTDRGRQIAAHARANAAAALRALGHDEASAARLAGSSNLNAAVATERAVAGAEQDYAAGLQAFERGDHQQARLAFGRAVGALERQGDTALLARARRARGWAARNQALRLDHAQALPLFEQARRDGEASGDPELTAMGAVGAALAAVALDRTASDRMLETGADLAERAGLTDEAVQCLAELAERGGTLERRRATVRRALALAPDAPAAVHAAYSLAVDAYNVGDPEFALRLVDELGEREGPLAEPLRAVREAARTSLEP